MKTLTTLAAFLVLSAGAAWAQSESTGSANNSVSSVTPNTKGAVAHDVTGFSNPYTGPGVTKEALNRPPNMHPNLKPKVSGAAVDTVTYGPVMLSPLAPESYGIGENYLSAPDPRSDTAHECGPAAHRDAGGIKVFSLEF